ncbi:MAG: hypothetical protein ACRD1S_00955 [Vicinamibacterales bacterium]
MRRRLNLTRWRCGYLLVKQALPPARGRKTRWDCECLLCGRTTMVRVDHLRSGHTTSCGCLVQTAHRDRPPRAGVQPPPVPSLKTTTAAEALRRFHDERSPLGAVRVVSRSVLDLDDEPGVVFDFDPFNR